MAYTVIKWIEKCPHSVNPFIHTLKYKFNFFIENYAKTLKCFICSALVCLWFDTWWPDWHNLWQCGVFLWTFMFSYNSTLFISCLSRSAFHWAVTMGGKMRASECLEHPDLPGEKKTVCTGFKLSEITQSTDDDIINIYMNFVKRISITSHRTMRTSTPFSISHQW